MATILVPMVGSDYNPGTFYHDFSPIVLGAVFFRPTTLHFTHGLALFWQPGLSPPKQWSARAQVPQFSQAPRQECVAKTYIQDL